MRAGLLVLVGLAGAIVGASLHYSLTSPDAGSGRLAPLVVGDDRPNPTASEHEQTTSGSATAERADLYRAAAVAPRGGIETMIREAAAKPRGAERTFALSVLLARYAEFDPRAAVDAAAGLAAEVRAPLYAIWAKTDPAAALAALASIKERTAARAIAAALVPALGGGDRALREVAAAVPFGIESAVYADALTARAADLPAVAFHQALELVDLSARMQALEGIAREWASTDPGAALAAVEQIYEPSQRQAFLQNVAKTWARLDPDAGVAYLKSADVGASQELLYSLGAQLAELRPREVLELVGTSTTQTSLPLRMMAIRALSNQDMTLAVRAAEALPVAGGQRDAAFAEIARAYGARDPDSALAWARSSGEASRITGVLQGIAQRDPSRAFDLAMAIDSPQQRMQVVQWIAMTATSPTGGNTGAIADRLLTLPDGDVRTNTLRQVLQMWSSRSPDAAVEWLMAHPLPDVQGSYSLVGQQLARSDPARAVEYTSRVPSAGRSEWLQGVAAGYAQNDPQAAAQWLEQYRGDPAYSSAILAVAIGLARTDPAGAARLLPTGADAQMATPAVYSIGMQWAQRDPRAAAAWATEYDASINGSVALPNVVGVWAQSDAPAARAYALRMASSPSRDAVLSSLLSSSARESVDNALLDAFSSPQMRNTALINAAMRLAGRDRAAATRFLDTYLTDDAMREQAKRNLQRVQPNYLWDTGGPISPTIRVR